jgi:dTDP-4-amino-4,6-dideoxygalactose transaminase
VVGEILSLPIFPDLDGSSVDTVAGAIRDFFAG